VSWHISATGTKDAVRRAVAEANVYGQAQGELAKRAIAELVDEVPTNGVRVEASGHHDKVWASCEIKVTAVHLVLDEPAAKPAHSEPPMPVIGQGAAVHPSTTMTATGPAPTVQTYMVGG